MTRVKKEMNTVVQNATASRDKHKDDKELTGARKLVAVEKAARCDLQNILEASNVMSQEMTKIILEDCVTGPENFLHGGSEGRVPSFQLAVSSSGEGLDGTGNALRGYLKDGNQTPKLRNQRQNWTLAVGQREDPWHGAEKSTLVYSSGGKVRAGAPSSDPEEAMIHSIRQLGDGDNSSQSPPVGTWKR
eukprot:308385-Amphidinium_carterae.5